MLMITKAVIPAAGLGTRFLPATKAIPKEMLPIVDKPVIQFVVEEAVAAGIKEIVIVVGRGKEAIENHFDTSFELEYFLDQRRKFELLAELKRIEDLAKIIYIRQKEPKGLGDAILCAKDIIGNEPFLVMLGDDIIKTDIPVSKQIIDAFNEKGQSIIATQEVPKELVSSYGIIKGTFEGKIAQIEDMIEKPSPEEAPSNIGVIGRYVLTPKIFEMLEKTAAGKTGEIELTNALKMLKDEEGLFAYKFEGRRFDTGNKKEYIKAILTYAEENPETKDAVKEYLEEKK